jgi:hypothetical protein
VFLNDPEYAARLAKYEGKSRFVGPSSGGGSAWARRVRYEGRQQLQAAELRLSEYRQEIWTEFLKDEQARLAKVVKTIPSDQYRNWAVMVSANITNVGGDLLPVITRN